MFLAAVAKPVERSSACRSTQALCDMNVRVMSTPSFTGRATSTARLAQHSRYRLRGEARLRSSRPAAEPKPTIAPNQRV